MQRGEVGGEQLAGDDGHGGGAGQVGSGVGHGNAASAAARDGVAAQPGTQLAEMTLRPRSACRRGGVEVEVVKARLLPSNPDHQEARPCRSSTRISPRSASTQSACPASTPTCAATSTTPGEFTWGGLAGTAFWVDPAEQLTAHFDTQLVPSATYPICTELRQLVYAALVE